jgi:hypothetical protein
MACNFCKDPLFLEWCGGVSEEQAKKFILDECLVSSRKDLDLCPDAAQKFHREFRIPFLSWKQSRPVQRAA